MHPKIKTFLLLSLPLIVIGVWMLLLWKTSDTSSLSTNIQEASIPSIEASGGTLSVFTGTGKILPSTPIILSESSGGTNSPSVLNIAMPASFRHSGRKPLKQALQNQGITLKAITYPDETTYYTQLASGLQSSQIDLFLGSTDHREDFSGSAQHLSTNTNLTPFFHYLFAPWIQRRDATMIPFAIDPMVMYTKDTGDLTVPLDRTTLIQTALISTESKLSKRSVPLTLGLSSYDIKLLQSGREVYPHYFDFLYQLILQSASHPDLITQLRDISVSGGLRDFLTFKKTTSKLITRNPLCASRPQLCLLKYGLTRFVPGYLSDADILATSLDTKDIHLTNFPVSTSRYPARLWGLMVSTRSTSPALSTFLATYMQLGIDGDARLRPRILSPFQTILSTQTTDPVLQPITRFLPMMDTIVGGSSTLSQMMTTTPLPQVLIGEYSIQSFITSTAN